MSFINQCIVSGSVSGIQMFRLFLLYDLSSLSLSFLPFFYFSVGWSIVTLDHCAQLCQQGMKPRYIYIYTPVWCIATSVHCNLWHPIICKVGRVRSTSLFRSSICLTLDRICNILDLVVREIYGKPRAIRVQDGCSVIRKKISFGNIN